MTNFTPISALLGGGMLGLAALILLKFNGRIAGISGVINGALQSKYASGDKTWRWIFLIGLMLGPLLAMPFAERVDITLEVNWTLIIVAGFLVGLGSSLGSGCTSGHSIC
ncbi:MAG: YeeE/YedE family protein, partial [Psychrobium sp.]|nr:YeeE/YedE family protein [Psychrobium sp.]